MLSPCKCYRSRMASYTHRRFNSPVPYPYRGDILIPSPTSHLRSYSTAQSLPKYIASYLLQIYRALQSSRVSRCSILFLLHRDHSLGTERTSCHILTSHQENSIIFVCKGYNKCRLWWYVHSPDSPPIRHIVSDFFRFSLTARLGIILAKVHTHIQAREKGCLMQCVEEGYLDGPQADSTAHLEWRPCLRSSGSSEISATISKHMSVLTVADS